MSPCPLISCMCNSFYCPWQCVCDDYRYKVTDCACSRGVWVMCGLSNAGVVHSICEMQSWKWNHAPAATAGTAASSQSDFPFALQGHSAGPAQQALTQLFYLSAPPCVHKFSINASFWYVETRNAACHKHHKLRKTLQNNVRKLWNVNAYEMCAYPDWHLPQIYAVLNLNNSLPQQFFFSIRVFKLPFEIILCGTLNKCFTNITAMHSR